MKNIGLVLEGGGMRGLYTSGVLDFFMEKGLYFPYVVGVSAGAGNATSYLSKQKGRNKKVMLDYVSCPLFSGIKPFIKERSFLGMNLIFEEIPKIYEPFDFEAFFNSNQRFVIGTTNCETGKPYYIEKDDLKEFSFTDFRNTKLLYAVRASSSLPFVSPYVDFNGAKLLDGGIVNPIPIKKAQEDGMLKNVVILTRNKEYRKTQIKHSEKIVEKLYNKNLSDVVKTRHENYNDTLVYLDELENDGRAFIIRPSKPINVDRFEKDKNKLEEIYLMGYNDALNKYLELQKFIEKSSPKEINISNYLNFNEYECACF